MLELHKQGVGSAVGVGAAPGVVENRLALEKGASSCLEAVNL